MKPFTKRELKEILDEDMVESMFPEMEDEETPKDEDLKEETK